MYKFFIISLLILSACTSSWKEEYLENEVKILKKEVHDLQFTSWKYDTARETQEKMDRLEKRIESRNEQQDKEIIELYRRCR